MSSTASRPILPTSTSFALHIAMSAYPLTAVNGSTLTGLLTPQGGHVLAFATCFGVNVWQTISGGIAFKVSSSSISSPLMPFCRVFWS